MRIVDLPVRYDGILRSPLLRVPARKHINNESIPISDRDGNSWRICSSHSEDYRDKYLFMRLYLQAGLKITSLE